MSSSVTVTVEPGSVEVGSVHLLHDYPSVKIVYMNLVTKNPEHAMLYGDGEIEVLLWQHEMSTTTHVTIKYDEPGNWAVDMYASKYTIVVYMVKWDEAGEAPALWEGRL